MLQLLIIQSLIITALFSVGIFLPSHASDDHEQARQLVEQGDILPLELVLSNLPEQVERILKVELEQEHGRRVYEVEILNSQGQVKEYVFDAKNGKIIKMENEN